MMYMVVRYTKNGPSRIVHTCLSREEAMAICQDPETKGGDWFMGFTAQRYRVVSSRSGRTLWTNLMLEEAEAKRQAKPDKRTILPVTR